MVARQLTIRPVEVRIENTALTQLLQPAFVAEVGRAFPGAKFVILRFFVPRAEAERASEGKGPADAKKKKAHDFEVVGLGHMSEAQEEKHVITVSCEDPETLETMERILANLPE